MTCDKTNCGRDAVCAVGIALFPPASLLAFYKTDKPLARLVLGLTVCQPHFDEVAADGPFALIQREKLASMAKVCEQTSGTQVDLDATKVVAVRLDDAEYQTLTRMRGAQPT